MWRVAPIDLKRPLRYPGQRSLSSAYAVAAVGILAVGCSATTVSASPGRSQHRRRLHR
jgi:hypothetical protein